MPLLKLAEHYFYILSRFFRVDSFFRPFRFALCHSSLYQKVKLEESMLYAKLALALVQSGRYAELAQVVEEIPAEGYANRISIAFARGNIYSQLGTNLELAIAHFRQVAELLEEWRSKDPSAANNSTFGLGGAKFEMAQIYAKQGDLTNAIKLYREGLESSRPQSDNEPVDMYVMFHNNLAYHLHLQGDPTAREHAETALALARERGVLSALPYLLSTNGEIALSRHEVDTAEAYFQEGLTLAQQFDAPERIAGLTANLGLVAKERGEKKRALELLQTSLTLAEAMDHHYLVAQIRLWMAPILPSKDGAQQIEMVRLMAEEYGFQHLVER
ncbi:hypothetical protein KFU94_11285 [Chloroflexi bacterium TSY]|nr:hypothetical protein [Chloroflexi bacterium TSY]